MDCENCSKARGADPVPYVVHESDMARLERTIKRLWILLLVLIALLAGSNAAWIYYESQWETIETTSTEIEQDTDGGGNNYVIGGDFNGEAKSQNNEDEKQIP
jgi:hypothetical protein